MKRSLQVLFFNRQPTNNPQPKVVITPFFLSKLFSTKTSFNTWVSLSDMNLVRPEGKGKKNRKGKSSHCSCENRGFSSFVSFSVWWVALTTLVLKGHVEQQFRILRWDFKYSVVKGTPYNLEEKRQRAFKPSNLNLELHWDLGLYS